jgi:DNA-binding IclR family transcriptional regulator
MTLDRALHGLVEDRAAETTVREVLQTLARHTGEWMPAGEVARIVGRPESNVSVILSRLASGSVLRSDSGRYRLVDDPVLDLELKQFLRRSEVHGQLAQDNLARFRGRFGQH